MPPLFTRLLAERLDKASAISVHEGEPGKILEPGHAWIAPGDYHMTLDRRAAGVYLSMNQAAPENSCRPAVDVLFRSVAAHSAPMPWPSCHRHGFRQRPWDRRRSRARRPHYVQDEATSVVWGMPGQTAAGVSPTTSTRWAILPPKSIVRRRESPVAGRQAHRSQVTHDARRNADTTQAGHQCLARKRRARPDLHQVRDLVYQACGIYHSKEKLYLLAVRASAAWPTPKPPTLANIWNSSAMPQLAASSFANAQRNHHR